MGDAGSAHARFRRALLTKNLVVIDAAARELRFISLLDALRILVVMSEKGDERFDRAAARWAERAANEAEVPIAMTWPLLDGLPADPDGSATRLRSLLGI